jgi:hypothetical protein
MSEINWGQILVKFEGSNNIERVEIVGDDDAENDEF